MPSAILRLLDRVPRFVSALALALAFALVANILWSAQLADQSNADFWRVLLSDDPGGSLAPYLSFLGAWIGFTLAGLRACTVPLWQLLVSGGALGTLSFVGPTLLDATPMASLEDWLDVLPILALDILRFFLLALLAALVIGRASRRA